MATPEMLDITGMHCLVTGGAGMIGSHIVKLLLEEHKCKVRVVDPLHQPNHPGGEKPDWVPAEVEFINGSSADRQVMERALEGIDLVFHEAVIGYEAHTTQSRERCFNSGATSTCVLFDVIQDKKIPVKKVVAASSMAVYGEASYKRKDGSEYIPTQYRSEADLAAGKFEVVDEKGEQVTCYPIKEGRALVPPAHPYHLTKLIQEKMTMFSGKTLNIPVTALRYTICHGPHQSLHNPYTGVLSVWANRIMNGKSPVVFEDGQQTRDFLFAEDCARANIHVARDPRADHQVYNVGTGRDGDTMHHVASTLCKLLNPEIKPAYNGDFRAWDTRHIRLDASKLLALGWKPRVTLEEGLKRQVDWVKASFEKAGGKIEDKFGKAYEELMAEGGIKRRKVEN